MKTIIAGGRDIEDRQHLRKAIVEFESLGYKITEVVSGKCPTGIDRMGETWASINSIPVKSFPADWEKNGKAAGPIRNREMAAYADALICVWDGKSRGSRNMIEEAGKKNLVVLTLDIISAAICLTELKLSGQCWA